MTWTSLGKMQSDKTSLQNAGLIVAKTSSTGIASVGYLYSSNESYFRIRNNILTGQLVFNETTTWVDNSGASEWRLIVDKSVIPQPKDLGSTFRVCGYATHNVFGNIGSDFIMEYVYNETLSGFFPSKYSMKFLVNNSGFLQILAENNKNTYLKQFFGTYGGIIVHLEYEV